MLKRVAKLEAKCATRDELESFIRKEGYRRCDIPACNCNSWHPHGGWYARFREIEEVVEPRNGETLLQAVKRAVLGARAGPICDTCKGDGEVDSGGVTSWGSPISLPCPECSK